MTESILAPPEPSTLLSIVVTIVDGGNSLEEFLSAMTSQEAPPPLEIIVPFDSSVTGISELAQSYPTIQFLGIGAIETVRPIESEAGQHELFDRRRAAGLAAARGNLIAILEDRGLPRNDWARTVVRLHEGEESVIGGAIECAPCGLLNWAFYVTDFGRYGLPFATHHADWVSDVNVTYKRDALEATRHLWKERFREPIVHWALIEKGEQLLLSSDLVVDHRRPKATLGELLPERFHWGRLFGHIRASQMSLAQRALFVLAGPLIPIALLLRHCLTQAKKGRLLKYLAASPLILILLCAWTSGEVWGYATGKA